MKLLIRANETLVFRDGRPFGDPGVVTGGMLRWPLPTSIAGMLRTCIGKGRDPSFFVANQETVRRNIEDIMAIKIKAFMPVWRGADSNRWQFLMPRPADALVTAAENDDDQVTVQRFKLAGMAEGAGTDLPWSNWLYPTAATLEKPAARQPDFWHWSCFADWLAQEKTGKIKIDDLGCFLPQPEVRIHTAIDSATGTVIEGKLFMSQGVRFATKPQDESTDFGELAIAVIVDNCLPDDSAVGPCHLGGERRTAFVEKFVDDWPACPAIFAEQRYLRIILATPGNFGAWAPKWLLPEGNEPETPWVAVPELPHIRIRLVTAFVPRWLAVSGWDQAAHKPKAMQKLVPAGSVYGIELAKPSQAQELAAHLWGRPLCPGQGCGDDGFGVAFVGNIKIEEGDIS